MKKLHNCMPIKNLPDENKEKEKKKK